MATIAAFPSLWQLVSRKLGLRSFAAEHEALAAVEGRLDLSVVQRLREAGLSEGEVSRYILPRRTLSHRAKRHEALTVDESDRAMRVARILSVGELVFGDKTKSDRWLRAKKGQFDERTPIEMLDTEIGARMVEEALYRIDDGIFA